jgi:hypothetical protein
LDPNPALIVPGAGDQVRIPAALADLGSLSGGRVRSLEVARGKVLFHDRQQQIAALGAFVLFVLEQPLRAGDPAGRGAHLSTKEETEAEPECGTDRAQACTGIEVRVMGTLERLQIIRVPTGQIRRHCQQVEILTSQSGRLIGERKRPVGVGSGAPRVVLAAAFERAKRGPISGVGLALVEVAHPPRFVAGGA